MGKLGQTAAISAQATASPGLPNKMSSKVTIASPGVACHAYDIPVATTGPPRSEGDRARPTFRLIARSDPRS